MKSYLTNISYLFYLSDFQLLISANKTQVIIYSKYLTMFKS